jgi:hypothetical protein
VFAATDRCSLKIQSFVHQISPALNLSHPIQAPDRSLPDDCDKSSPAPRRILQISNDHFPRHHNYSTTLFDDMEDKTGSPLLDLPAEIRNRVYEHVVPDVPLRYPRSNYVGLVYSSKQLRSELEPIVITKTVAWLEVIADSCLRDFNDIFTFTCPQTLHDLENLKLHGQISFEKTLLIHRTPRTHRHHRINLFLCLHFESLAITLACNHFEPSQQTHCIVATDWILRCFSYREKHRVIPCRRFKFDWSEAFACPLRVLKRPQLNEIESHGDWSVSSETNPDGSVIIVSLERIRRHTAQLEHSNLA